MVETKTGAYETVLEQKLENVIRLIAPDDREPLRALSRAAHQRTVFGGIAFSDAKFDKAFDKVLENPKHSVCLLALSHDKIVGALWASTGTFFIGEDELFTTVHMLAVDPETQKPFMRAKTFLRLVKAIRQWSKSRGAKHVLVHVTTGTDLKASDKMLRAAGGKCFGGAYVL